MTPTTPSRLRHLETAHRVRVWREASPMDEFVAERIKNAPGSRLAIMLIWHAWQRHADAFGHEHGTASELVAAVRRAYPGVLRVKARSGRDVHKGDHLAGVWLR